MKLTPLTTETQRHRGKSGRNLVSRLLGILCVSVSLWWILGLTGCERKLPIHEEQGYVFGTLVDISIYGEEEGKAQKAVTSVMQEFQRLHNLLHAWQPSELSSLNEAIARGQSREVPPEIAAMLKDAARSRA